MNYPLTRGRDCGGIFPLVHLAGTFLQRGLFTEILRLAMCWLMQTTMGRLLILDCRVRPTMTSTTSHLVGKSQSGA